MKAGIRNVNAYGTQDTSIELEREFCRAAGIEQSRETRKLCRLMTMSIYASIHFHLFQDEDLRNRFNGREFKKKINAALDLKTERDGVNGETWLKFSELHSPMMASQYDLEPILVDLVGSKLDIFDLCAALLRIVRKVWQARLKQIRTEVLNGSIDDWGTLFSNSCATSPSVGSAVAFDSKDLRPSEPPGDAITLEYPLNDSAMPKARRKSSRQRKTGKAGGIASPGR
ncbi:MAG: hypothetical protein KDG55_00510 [Rhodocyclaceae bacterium]|nr:hypothetical protein [Rhodocyclaceae bacterium]